MLHSVVTMAEGWSDAEVATAGCDADMGMCRSMLVGDHRLLMAV